MFGSRESERKKERKKREKRENKSKTKNKTLFTKAVNETYKNSPKACKTNYLPQCLLQNERSLYRQPQGMKIPKNLTTKLSYWTKE